MKFSLKPQVFSLIVIVIILFIIINATGLDKGLKNAFFTISSPVQRTFWQWGENVSGFFSVFFEISSVKEREKELTLKYQEVLGENAVLKELEKENGVLREALGIGLEKEFQLEIAEVVGKDVSQDSILINKGAKDGVLRGQPVVTPSKVLLGKIGEVYQDFSEVVLLFHPNSSFDARILDKDIYGLARGKGGGLLSLDLISKENVVETGDIVVTTALGETFPKGLLVGEVRSVDMTDAEPFQTAVIDPMFSVQDLDYLFIIIGF